VHFFLDDYRFETVWTKPERGLSRCANKPGDGREAPSIRQEPSPSITVRPYAARTAYAAGNRAANP
jgi:hypothetical protein